MVGQCPLIMPLDCGCCLHSVAGKQRGILSRHGGLSKPQPKQRLPKSSPSAGPVEAKRAEAVRQLRLAEAKAALAARKARLARTLPLWACHIPLHMSPTSFPTTQTAALQRVAGIGLFPWAPQCLLTSLGRAGKLALTQGSGVCLIALLSLQEAGAEDQSPARMTACAALIARQGRRVTADDVLRVRRRNDEMLRRRVSCSDAAAERAALQEARFRRLAQQV